MDKELLLSSYKRQNPASDSLQLSVVIYCESAQSIKIPASEPPAPTSPGTSGKLIAFVIKLLC